MLPGYSERFMFCTHRHREPVITQRTSTVALFFRPEHADTCIHALSPGSGNLCRHDGVFWPLDVTSRAAGNGLETKTITPLREPRALQVRRRVETRRDGRIAGVDQRRGAANAGALPFGPGRHISDPDQLPRPLGRPAGRHAGAGQISASGRADCVKRSRPARTAASLGCEPTVWDTETASTSPGDVLVLVRAGVYIANVLLLAELAFSKPASCTVFRLPFGNVAASGFHVTPSALPLSPADPDTARQ
jgi:hypothetical protein